MGVHSASVFCSPRFKRRWSSWREGGRAPFFPRPVVRQTNSNEFLVALQEVQHRSFGNPHAPRTHAQIQKQDTVERLWTAITSLQAQHQPISARTIYEECGLAYASIRRNPEALLLYQQHSTFLKHERKRTRTACPDSILSRDPLLAYKKPDLVARIRQAQARCVEVEKQHATILADYVQKDVKIAELEAELARYREYFEGLRLQVQQKEHGG